jgi:hypothetical protein
MSEDDVVGSTVHHGPGPSYIQIRQLMIYIYEAEIIVLVRHPIFISQNGEWSVGGRGKNT